MNVLPTKQADGRTSTAPSSAPRGERTGELLDEPPTLERVEVSFVSVRTELPQQQEERCGDRSPRAPR